MVVERCARRPGAEAPGADLRGRYRVPTGGPGGGYPAAGAARIIVPTPRMVETRG